MTRVESPANAVLLFGFVDRFVCHAQTADAFRYEPRYRQGAERAGNPVTNERSSPSFVFDRVRRIMHNCSMGTFHTTTIAANVHRTQGVLRKTVKFGLRWIGYIVLAALLVAVIGACLALVSLLIAAQFDPTVGCPATDTGCQPPAASDKHCSWLESANSCENY
jgi:hypothetical protein